MIQAYINNIPYEMTRNFLLTDMVGNKSASEIAFLVEDQPLPRAGDMVEIRDGDTVLFWGMLGIPQSPRYSSGLEWRVYNVEAGNANTFLSKRIINEAFKKYTVSEIVRILYDNYIAEEGISLGTVSDIPIKIDVYAASDFNLQDALNELAELANAAWTITTQHVFNFTVSSEFKHFPVTVDRGNVFGTDWQIITKEYKQRTVQYVSGATNTTLPQTERFIYDASGANTFNVSFGLNERPTITVNGVAVEPERVGVAGLDYGDSNVYFTFAYNSNTISYNTSSGFLSGGETVAITYIGIYPIRVSMSNLEKISEIASITGTSGKREIVNTVTGVRSQADAVAMALSLLDKYREATEEITMWVPSEELYKRGITLEDTEPMTKITINLPEWGMVGDYVIAERRLSAYYADMSEDAAKRLKVWLRLLNRDYMKSYGEILADLRKNVRALNIRADDIVLKNSLVSETIKYGESYSTMTLYPFFPVASEAEGGALFAPISLDTEVYPV